MSQIVSTVLIMAMCFAGLSGCSTPNIQVDLSSDRPRFIIHHPTWGWPFRWPRVDGFAIASGTEHHWELKAVEPSGAPARDLAIVYGEVPNGFYQVFPEKNAKPRSLRAGEIYWVGATGSDTTYHATFALPVDRFGIPPPRPFSPGERLDDGDRPEPPKQAKPAD
ncbi:MAG: hypothetical protein ACE5EC_09570 [Phycisphaerae bacterium]